MAFMDTPYDRRSNPTGNAIGSPLNVNISYKFSSSWKLNPNWALSTGLSFTHYSNGASHLPNYGINIAALTLGARYTPDPFKLEQVLINLIDNAIKYTERGEIVISVSQRNETIITEIQDTGIGIPREHLSRIFERFYVVDKSRSRKLGGTGLGLSIVKHIVLLHKGKIDVENIPGTGTKRRATGNKTALQC